VLTGVAAVAIIGIAANMMSPQNMRNRRMRRRVNSTMRAIGEAADSVSRVVGDIL